MPIMMNKLRYLLYTAEYTVNLLLPPLGKSLFCDK